MTKKENDLSALFADALKAVEKIESQDDEHNSTSSTEPEIELEIEVEVEVESPTQEDSSPTNEMEELNEEEEIEFDLEVEELDEDAIKDQLLALNESHAHLKKEHQTLEDKCRRAIRSLRKHKREEDKAKNHNELLRREISRLQGMLKQSDRKLEMLESRQESSKEALESANQRIDSLSKAIKQQEGMIDRSKRLRQKEQEQSKKFGAAPAITKLLPAIDSVELALLQSTDNVEAFQEGLRIALNQFHGTLESIGISKIPSGPGILFDPNYHEAVMRIPSEEVPPNHILECFCEAYIMNGRLLRPAKVSVAMSG